MKFHILFSALTAIFLVSACSGHDWHRPYDSEVCSQLSVKIDSRQPLTQEDYASMIAQNEDILKYIIERSRDISEMPDSTRPGAWRDLLADPEYLERFGYMFTLGSALYQADADGLLDDDNAKHYAELDRYNEDLVAITDRNWNFFNFFASRRSFWVSAFIMYFVAKTTNKFSETAVEMWMKVKSML